jgi:PEP-CTERM motif
LESDVKKAIALAVTLVVSAAAPAAPILVNGDFEAPPILGPGQTGVPVGSTKHISTSPAFGGYPSGLSGITGWRYATPLDSGTASDHGLARRNGSFGLSTAGQSAFINNWNRMMSQTVTPTVSAGDVVTATIDFGTLGATGDRGRAGRFYLVAGEANPLNLDQFSSRSIILDEVSIANPGWTLFTPDVTVGNGQYTTLTLTYTYRPGDPALGLPLTVAFRTVTSSVGPTYWDNASLTIQSVPEPSTLVLFGTLAAGSTGVWLARRRKAVAPMSAG